MKKNIVSWDPAVKDGYIPAPYVLEEGESAVKDYLGFLSGGCSKSPIDLLKGAGVDMTSPEPVNAALKLFGELLDEMEELTADL